MRRIGLLGGMSWQSTALYYRLLNDEAEKRLGGLHSADCVVVSVDFDRIAGFQATGRWAEAGEMLGDAARRVEAAGADLLLVCTNTMHKVADQIQDAVGIPLVHIVDTTAAEARRLGLRRLGLLGTGFTMEQPFYRERLESHGLEVILPDSDSRELVHRVIYEELCHGTTRCPVLGSPGSSRNLLTRAPKASSWAAPRSSCSSDLRTALSRSLRRLT